MATAFGYVINIHCLYSFRRGKSLRFEIERVSESKEVLLSVTVGITVIRTRGRQLQNLNNEREKIDRNSVNKLAYPFN